MGKISQYSDVPVPKLSDMLIGTSVGLNEDDQVENQTYNFTLQQLLDLFVPNIPSNSLQGVLDNGNTATQDINLFGKITTTDLEVTNNATFNNAYFPENMYVPGLIFDETYVSGTDGQVLSRTATGVKWITLPDIFTPNLQQVLNVGNVASTDIQLSATLFADAVDSDNITSNTSLIVSGELIDKDGASGLNGQVLTSTGSGKVQWQNQSAYTGVAPISVNSGIKEISISQSGSTSDGYLSSTDWNTFDSKQDGLFGTGLVKSTAGVITYVTDGSADWNSAYNDTITSAGVTGTTTKTLTLNQRDGGTITASWTDISTAPVTSVFGRTGDVVAQNGDYNTSQVTESTNLYYTDARARAAISLTTNGTSGAATYNSTTGILNIPNYGGSSTGYVPYTGATNDVLLGTHYLSADYLKISTTTAHSASVAEIVWNANNGTFDMGLLNGVTLQVGQEFHFYGKASGAIPNGSPVMFAGAQGNHLLMSVATPSVINAHPEYFVGVATQAFTNNQFGYITVFGQVRDLNTIAYPEGTVLYFNSVSGGFTTTVPSAPNAKIIVAAVVRSHATQGSLMVRPHVMPMLSDIQDVGVSGLAENDVLVYDTNKWVNKTIAEILGYTPASLSSFSASSPLSYNNTTGAFSIQQANGSQNGYLSSTDWTTFNNKIGGSLITNNIPKATGTAILGNSSIFDDGSSVYVNTGSGPNTSKLIFTTSGVGSFLQSYQNLTAENNNIFINYSGGNVAIGTVSSPSQKLEVGGNVKANSFIGSLTGNASTASALYSPRTLTIGNTGKSFDGTANVSWTLGEIGAQAAGNYITSLTGEATASGPGAAAVTLTTSAVTGKILSGLNITGGTVVDTDTILTAFGKLQNQINGLIGGSIYKGTWNASTNTPTLTSSVGTKGWYYIVNVAGTTNLNGITDWQVGDWAIFDGSAWQKVDNTDAVVSVNGFTGAVSLTTANIPEATNLYYTDTRARSALSFAAGSGAYNSSTGVITIPTNTSQLTNGANFITLTSLSASSPLSYNNGTGAFSIQQATSSQDGYISSTDWSTFNGKVSSQWTTSGSNIYYNVGNVGIGTTSPSYKLQVIGSTFLIGATRISADTTGLPAYTESGWVGYSGSTLRQYIGDGSGYDYRFAVRNAGIDYDKITIKDNGNVGIGTNSPDSRLHINNDGVSSYSSINITNANSSANFFVGVGGNSVANTSLRNNAYMLTSNASNLILGTNDTERMRITSGGNVGIGTTSPATKLDVAGAITASGGFFNSDIRLKDIIDYEYSVSDIKPITYTWKDKRDDKKHIGYSAQDVQKVMPDAVNEDAEGMLSVNYVEILVAKIAELENRIKQLENGLE